MKLWIAAVILTFGCFMPSFSEEEKEARLLVSKNVLNKYLVEGKDLTVEYKIYNIGTSPAFDVRLFDISFPESAFATVSGSLRASWERISPLTNLTHVVVLKPLKSGNFNFTAAEISYATSENRVKRVAGSTSFPGEGGIVPQREFNRRFSAHVLDWLVFAFMTLPSLGMPYLLWYKSKSRYEEPKAKSS